MNSIELKTRVLETFEPYAENISSSDGLHFETSLGLYVVLTNEENYYYNEGDNLCDMEYIRYNGNMTVYIDDDYADFEGVILHVQ
jgi:hypothetical protein